VAATRPGKISSTGNNTARNYSGPVVGLSSGDARFSADDGSAEPAVAAALAAFAAGTGSEHAALLALAGGRLLVPVVAAPVPDDGAAEVGAAGVGAAEVDAAEKTSEMSIPTLMGHDGRAAVPVFTCLAAMNRWQPGARPVPVDAVSVWRSAVSDSCAVVLDVAGPVPLAVDGARLAALAAGEAVPPPQQDPDVHAAVSAAIAGWPQITGVRLAGGGADADLTIELSVPPGPAGPASELARAVAAEVMARLGGRLRRGVQIAVS
jgi:SseB protein N-terminal domain